MKVTGTKKKTASFKKYRKLWICLWSHFQWDSRPGFLLPEICGEKEQRTRRLCCWSNTPPGIHCPAWKKHRILSCFLSSFGTECKRNDRYPCITKKIPVWPLWHDRTTDLCTDPLPLLKIQNGIYRIPISLSWCSYFWRSDLRWLCVYRRIL